MKKYLITGCEGFIGSHLADFLVEKNLPVFGMVYEDAKNINHLKGKITTFKCDLKDREKVEEIVNEVKPDIVFHLAAQSYVTVSWEDPEETLKTNILGSFYLLDTIRKIKLDPVIEIVGTSAIYGPRDKGELPLGEKTDFRPTSMYAVSKVGEEMLGYFYWKVFGMKVIRVRPFNMTGPRKIFDACSDFSKGIVEIEKGLKDILKVGNLETVRDFTDGRDAVKALWLLVERGTPGELYNLCSGKSYKMQGILDMLISLSGDDIEYQVDPEKIRPSDDPMYIGDSSKLQNLGWRPRIPMKKTLFDMLNFWRKNLS